MTNEEAIAWLEHHFDPLPDGTKQSEAVSLAINALETIPKYKDAYGKGWEDGARATNVDCGVVWEERIDAIKQEIREAKSDNHAGGVLFIEQAYDICLAIIDEHCGDENE